MQKASFLHTNFSENKKKKVSLPQTVYAFQSCGCATNCLSIPELWLCCSVVEMVSHIMWNKIWCTEHEQLMNTVSLRNDTTPRCCTKSTIECAGCVAYATSFNLHTALYCFSSPRNLVRFCHSSTFMYVNREIKWGRCGNVCWLSS